MLEGIALGLAALGFWFWAVTGLVFLAILFFEENENNIGAFVVLALFVTLMEWSNALEIFSDPLTMLMYLAGYYAIGSGWSFMKWLSFLHKRADDFVEHKLTWIGRWNKNMIESEKLAMDPKIVLTPEQKHSLKKYLETEDFLSGYSGKSAKVIPLASENKSKIVTWILWWPCSALWTILNDPLVRLANYLYARFQGLYTRMANRVFKKYNVDDL